MNFNPLLRLLKEIFNRNSATESFYKTAQNRHGIPGSFQTGFWDDLFAFLLQVCENNCIRIAGVKRVERRRMKEEKLKLA